ncbi:hypothetical protein HPB51_021351 [Rhipicephalus microplus]|uniref:VWFC domain-containing protein n=1 Tax=Rhipicephalus microplus TaxID=6941 RepID=A0A9J6F7V6_RHIMP|nr:hypothetical protein HPB51_021351 [Rhipicephalus microplus]
MELEFSTSSEGNLKVCNVDGVLYQSGDPIPTEDPCETCKCRPPGFACILRECEVKPNCKAVRREGQCCPEYHCGCQQGGTFYKDGEVVPSPQSPCYVCYCQGSSISCSLVACRFRGDCEPRYVDGECCPRYDHCPPTGISTRVVSHTCESARQYSYTWDVCNRPRGTHRPQQPFSFHGHPSRALVRLGRFFTTRFEPTTIPGAEQSTYAPGVGTSHGVPVTRFEPTTVPGGSSPSHRAQGSVTKGGVLFTRTAFPTSTEPTRTTERFRPEQTAFPSSLYDDLSSPQPVPDVTNPVKRYTSHLPPPEETGATAAATGGAQSTDSVKPLDSAVQSQDVDDKFKSTVGKDATGTTAAVGSFPATIVHGAAVPVVPAVLPEAGPVVIANVPVHPVISTAELGTVQPTATGTVLNADAGIGVTSSTGIQGGAATAEGTASPSTSTVVAGTDHSTTIPAVETNHGAAVDSTATTAASVADATHALAGSDATTHDDASSPTVTASSELHNGASSTGAQTDVSTSTSGVNVDNEMHAMTTVSGDAEVTEQAASEGATYSQTLTPDPASVSKEATSTSGPTYATSTATENVSGATSSHTAQPGANGSSEHSSETDASSVPVRQSDSTADTGKKVSDCAYAGMHADAPGPASAATDSSATIPVDSKQGPTTGDAGSAATSAEVAPAKASVDSAPVTGFGDAFPAASNGDATSATAPGGDATATTSAAATLAPASSDDTPASPSVTATPSGEAAPGMASSDAAPAVASGEVAPVAPSGDSSPVAASGDAATQMPAGDATPVTAFADAAPPAVSSGDAASATALGDTATSTTTDDATPVPPSSDATPAPPSGDAAATTTNDETHTPASRDAVSAPASSESALASGSSDSTPATATGNSAFATDLGEASSVATTGDSASSTTAENSVSAAASGAINDATASSDTQSSSAASGSEGSVQYGESSGSSDITPAQPASSEFTTPAAAPSPSLTEEKSTEQESSSESSAMQAAEQGADQTTTTAASVAPEAVSTTVEGAAMAPFPTDAVPFGDSQSSTPAPAAEEHPLGDEPHHDEGVAGNTEAPKQEEKPVTDAPAYSPADEHPLGDAPVVPDAKTEENEAVPPMDSNESGAPQQDEKSNDVSDSASPTGSITPADQETATDAFGARSGTDSTSPAAPKSEDTTVSENVEREEHPEGEPDATNSQPAETATTTTESPHSVADDDSSRTPVSETPIVPEEAHTVSPDNEAEKPEASTEPPQNDAPPPDSAAAGDSGAPHDDGVASGTPIPRAEGSSDLPPIGAAPAAPEPEPQPAPVPKPSNGNGGRHGHGHEHKPHVHHDYGGRVPPSIEQLLAQLSPDTRRQYELDHGIVSPQSGSGSDSQGSKPNEVTDAPKATEFPTRYTTTPTSAGDNGPSSGSSDGYKGDEPYEDDKTKSGDATAVMTHDPIVQLVKTGIPDLHLEGAEPHRDRRRSQRRAH